MAKRIQEGEVQGLRVGRFKGAVNTTSLVYRIGDALIDTGPANQWGVVRRFVEETHPRQVILTHHHEDHSGNARLLKRIKRLPVYAPELSIPLLAGGFKVHLYRRLVWGKPALVQVDPVPAVVEVGGGMTLRRIAAPGHSIDMTCYLVPERGWLFSGDLFVAALPRYLRSDEDFPEQLKSIRSILEHEFDTVFCAHRGVVANGRLAFRRKLEYLETLRLRARRLHQEGREVPEITRLLLGKEDFLSWFSGGHFRKSNLIKACLGHETAQ